MVPLEGQPEPIEPEKDFQEQEYQRICQLLDRIPSEQAEVIRLRYYGDKSFREIAVILDLPLTTVKSRFQYGIDKIRREVRSSVT
jgi:RNA polymerase sigma-70 factor (ECF subfamily)